MKRFFVDWIVATLIVWAVSEYERRGREARVRESWAWREMI